MKNNKKSPFTIARQANWLADMGGTYKEVTKPSAAFIALCAELVGIDTPEMKQSRIAMEATAQGYRENTPELYGRKSVEIDFGCGYRVHPSGTDCNPELSENESALVHASGHDHGENVMELPI